jgi:membrane-bound inhibitor of C-type lysozyme
METNLTGAGVTRQGLLFEAGSYPQQGITVTPADLARTAEEFTPADLSLEHVPTVLDGKLGRLTRVWTAAGGRELHGEAVLPDWLARLFGDAPVSVSCVFDKHTVAMTGVEDAYTYTVTIAGTTPHTVSFVTDEDEVTSILVDGNVVVFSVPVSGGGSVVKSIGGLNADDDAFEALNDAYEEVMGFFGFDYDAEGLLQAKHFERKATSLNLKDEAVIQLYTADIVVPGGVTPPKTGDAATVVGFVMIAVAMIAAGVVVSRKVRA